ncbi:arginine--tRNA ligase [Candidatus Woesearchaeota archaeon]|nr:arginine--tRNA ligase [Candidatus Woesearchaeota archaeon]
MFKLEVAKLLAKATSLKESEIEPLIEVPPSQELGDFAFPCFILAKSLKKAPNIIAQELANKIKPDSKSSISDVKAVGAYLNFFVNKSKLSEGVIKDIINCGACYGSWPLRKEKVMVEYPAPNTNKPLHLGHVRNILLGNSICNILAFAGFQVIPVDLVNDRGVHICKSMLAYQKWGKNKEPDKKSDHFVGDFYVLYSKEEKEHPEMEDEIQDLLRKWEAGDKETVALWNKMRKWSLDGFRQTYALFDVHHKKVYYESEIYQHGKELILEGLKKGLFKKDEKGAVVADLEKEGLGTKVLLREDGTGIYITQDLYLAKLKFDEFKMDSSVYVVANEQIYHFNVLFKLLDMLGFPFAKNCHHLAYGMISLPEGRMKSREGTVVDADDLVKEMEAEAEEEIKKRHKLDANEVEKRKKIIAMGALKFFIIKYDPMKDFTYDPKESISFEGETGPYVQYAHARICSIFRNTKKFDAEKADKIKPEFSHELEFKLIKLLADFKNIVNDAAEQYKPSLVARYALELAQAFNEFYHECPVLKADKKLMESRLVLIFCVKQVLKNSLDLLGIKAPEEM